MNAANTPHTTTAVPFSEQVNKRELIQFSKLGRKEMRRGVCGENVISNPYTRMNTTIKDCKDLVQLLNRDKEITFCNHTKFDEWSRVELSELDELKLVGEVSIRTRLTMNTNYWGKHSPIELEKYPYSTCKIFMCLECKGKFFYYIEDSGHAPERRLRRIHKESIVNKGQEYYLNLAMPRSIMEFHQIIKEDLNFPDFYGNNWDALWDTITGIVELPEKVFLYNYDVFLKNQKKEAEPLKEIVERYNIRMKTKIILTSGPPWPM